jgi:hypothetical protein
MTRGHGSYKFGWRRINYLTSALLIVGAASSSLPVAEAQPVSDPNPAVNSPDKFAWDLFAEINRPALIGSRGIADPTKKVSDPGLRVWETWKITTPIGSEVFLKGGPGQLHGMNRKLRRRLGNQGNSCRRPSSHSQDLT